MNVDTKDLIDLCRQAGFDVKNQLSSLDPDQRDTVVQLLKRGGGSAVAVAAPPKSAGPVIPQVMTPVPVLHAARATRRDTEPKGASSAAVAKAPPSSKPAA